MPRLPLAREINEPTLAVRPWSIPKLVDGPELRRPQPRVKSYIIDGRTIASRHSRSAPFNERAEPRIREAQCLFIGDLNWRRQAWASYGDLLKPCLGSDRQRGQ